MKKIFIIFFCGLTSLASFSQTRVTEEQLDQLIIRFIQDMIPINGGSFIMGDNNDPLASPEHRVFLSDYYISKCEVTQEFWEAIMGNNPSYHKGANKPVENVTWNECQIFISRLNSITDMEFHLPTEAQWEYAAIGGNRSRGYVYSGSNNINDVAWFKDNSQGTTHPVGYLRPNELGIHDMNGNVGEWCHDYWDSYSINEQTNPTGPRFGDSHVVRGGSFGYDKTGISPTRRTSNSIQGFQNSSSVGFRLALD